MNTFSTKYSSKAQAHDKSANLWKQVKGKKRKRKWTSHFLSAVPKALDAIHGVDQSETR